MFRATMGSGDDDRGFNLSMNDAIIQGEDENANNDCQSQRKRVTLPCLEIRNYDSPETFYTKSANNTSSVQEPRSAKLPDVAADLEQLRDVRSHRTTSTIRPTKGGKSIKSGESNSSNAVASNQPGAEYIRRRAPGLNPNFINLHLPRQNEAVIVEAVASISHAASHIQTVGVVEQYEQQKRKKWYCMPVAVVLASLLVGGSIGLGVAYGIKGKTNNSESPSGVLPPFTVDCYTLHNRAQPDPVTQCHCWGNITIVADEVAARYYNLTETFMPTTHAKFYEAILSCNPRNQALLWLASDNGGGSTLSEPALLQRYNLALLFILWNGPRWNTTNGWLSSYNECNWYGITCNDQLNVTSISLSRNTLTGELEPAATLFTGLVSLKLDGNNFLGSTFPSQVGAMSNLRLLQLNLTGIDGVIPDELFNLNETLQYLNVARNFLTGTIPTRVAKLQQLQRWIAGDNNIVGSIPTEFGRCTKLLGLDLGQNFLNGTIPTQLGLLSAIEELHFDQNILTGTFASELCRFENLTFLNVGNNLLHGTLSSEIGFLSSLQYLYLQGNGFSGTIPSNLGDCSSLLALDVSHNQLNGTVPVEFGLFQFIEEFDMEGDNFTGGAPYKLCQDYSDVYKPAFHCGGCLCDVPLNIGG